MHIAKILEKQKTTLSFEFYPPRTDKGFSRLFETIAELAYLEPGYVSVTYGAGGSTRERTHRLITKIQQTTPLTVVSHLTCVGHSKDDIQGILEKYTRSGIQNILALRGDPPTGDPDFQPSADGFAYAQELVAFIKERFPQMGIGVAGFPEGHPATPNRLKEIEYLKQKVEAGADYIVTQLFFNNDDFYDFKERCEIEGINVPIVAGIMPVTSVANMKRMSELSLGARIPAKLLKAIYRAPDDAYVENVGIHWAASQVNDLIEKNVDGIHFYTLNKSSQIKRICESIGLISSTQLG